MQGLFLKFFHFLGGECHTASQQAGVEVDLRGVLHGLHAPVGLLQIGAHGEHAVVGQQHGVVVPQQRPHGGGEGQGAMTISPRMGRSMG